MCVLQLCLSNLRSLETQTLAVHEAVKPSAARTKICLAQLSQNPQRDVLGDAGPAPWCAQLGSIWADTVLWSKGLGWS